MIQVCSQCGAVSNQDVQVCPFCEAPFAESASPRQPNSSEEPEWRREVARRLEVYRSRRYDRDESPSEPVLPFSRAEAPAVITTAVAPRTIARLRPTQRVEIHLSQPQLDFSVVEASRSHPAAASFPVADLTIRGFAALVDATVIFGVFAGFLLMFRSLGGQLEFLKINFAIYAAILGLIYFLYFGLFTLFSGATVGMQVNRLSVMAMDGGFPDTRQLAWRSFGYLFSAGTIFLGFLWALWDDDHLTWQDRVSHTYITSAPVDEYLG